MTRTDRIGREQKKAALVETAERTYRNPYLFIVGCARSGTTLLHRIVDAHPLIAITPEMHWISQRLKNLESSTARMIPTEVAVELTEHKRFSQFGIDREAFQSLASSTEPVSYTDFLTGVFELYGETRSRPIVGNKTPAYVRRIPELHALWPHAKFVHIIRDGRDVALSVLNWKKADRTAGRFSTWEEDPISTTALWWERKVRTGREAGSALGPDLYHEIRYEDLVSNTRRECVALCDFLKVPYDDAMVRFHEGKTRTDLPDARKTPKKAWLPITGGLKDWRTDMSAEDVERFEAAAGGLLGELGYERTVPKPSPRAVEQAARIRESFGEDIQGHGLGSPERLA
ncbi:MAG TPA: sulfotransferase [Rubrobacteraceae bacterium]|nr:sulfotransferase [Rubrobacteraceae bacterium]